MSDEALFGTSVVVFIFVAFVVAILLWAVPVRLWVEALTSGVARGHGAAHRHALAEGQPGRRDPAR